MKRGTPDHPKTVCLQATLGLDRMGVVGLLELLWHFTAKYAPQGDIGRWTDANIAQGVHWTREPAELIDALVKERFLDSSKANRLLVHDWHDHADDATRKNLSRNGLDFLTRSGSDRKKSRHVTDKSGQCPDKSRQVDTNPENGGLPLPCLALPSLASPGNGTPLPPASGGIAATPLKPSPSKREGWTTQAGEDYEERYGGAAPFGVIGKFLKPLVALHGWPQVRKVWRHYLATREPTYATPAGFAQKYGVWLDEMQNGGGRVMTEMEIQAEASRLFREEDL